MDVGRKELRMQATATRTSFLDRLERGDVLIADGATGTTCQHMGLPARRRTRGVGAHRAGADRRAAPGLRRGRLRHRAHLHVRRHGPAPRRRPVRRPRERAQPPRRRAGARGRRTGRPRRRLAGPDGPAVRAARHAHARRGRRRLRRAGRGARRGRRRPARARDDVLPDRGRARRSTACAARPTSRSCSRSRSTAARAR